MVEKCECITFLSFLPAFCQLSATFLLALWKLSARLSASFLLALWKVSAKLSVKLSALLSAKLSAKLSAGFLLQFLNLSAILPGKLSAKVHPVDVDGLHKAFCQLSASFLLAFCWSFLVFARDLSTLSATVHWNFGKDFEALVTCTKRTTQRRATAAPQRLDRRLVTNAEQRTTIRKRMTNQNQWTKLCKCMFC